MNQTTGDLILASFNALKRGNNEEIANANQVLSNLISTPIFNELCTIATNDEDPYNRFIAVITIKQSLNLRKDNITQDEASLVKDFIINYIFREGIERNREFIILMACSLVSKALHGDEKLLPLFGDLSVGLIQSSIQMAESNGRTALFYIAQLIDFKIINTPEQFISLNMPEITHKLILMGLLSEGDGLSSSSHERAIDLLHVIEINQICENYLENLPDIRQALINEAQFSIYSSPTDEESMKLFSFLGWMAFNDPDGIEELFNFCLKFTYDTIKNQQVSPTRRETALLFFNGAFLNQSDTFGEMLDQIINITFDIMRCQCTEDPETYQPFCADQFLKDLAGEEELTEEVYAVLMNLAKTTCDSGDIFGFKTAISCLIYITENASEIFESNSDEICPIIITAINLDNPFIFPVICDLISQLSKYAIESIMPIYDDLTSVLIKYHKYPESFECLENVLFAANRPPVSYDQYISSLLSFVNGQIPYPQDRLYKVIQCISDILSKVQTIDENLYVGLRPFLIGIIQNNPDLRSDVFLCFAYCSKIAPRLIVEDIQSFANAMIQDLANASDPSSLDLIAESVIEILKYIPESFYPFAPNFFQGFVAPISQILQVANQDVENTEENEELLYKVDQYQRICSQILSCLSYLFASYPNDLAGQFNFIFQTISDFLISGKTHFIIGSADSIIIISPFLSLIGVHPNAIIVPLINIIMNNEHTSEDNEILLQSAFNALEAVMHNSGNEINGQALESLGVFFIECLDMKIDSITYLHNKSIRNDLQGFVMNALDAFLMGGAFINFEKKSAIVELLINHLNNGRKKQFQSYAIAALARICFVYNPATTAPIAPMLIDVIFKLFASNKKITDYIRNSYIFSLVFILFSHPNVANADLINQIKMIALNNLSFNSQQDLMLQKSASMLLIVLLSLYHIEIEPELLHNILSLLPDSDDEGIIVYASCIFNLVHGNEQQFQGICDIGKIATIIALAPAWCTSKMPNDVFNYYVEIIKGTPEETLRQLLDFNQAEFLKIRKHLQ